VSFVTNGIHLQFKRRITCKSCTKYFTWSLFQTLAVDLAWIIPLRDSSLKVKVIYVFASLLWWSQFLVFSTCTIYCLLVLLSVSITIKGSGFPLLSQVILGCWELSESGTSMFESWCHFFKYRDVVKTATWFCCHDDYNQGGTIIRVALTFVESVDKMEFLLNFSEQWTFSCYKLVGPITCWVRSSSKSGCSYNKGDSVFVAWNSYIPRIKVTRYMLDNRRNDWSYLILTLDFVARNWGENCVAWRVVQSNHYVRK